MNPIPTEDRTLIRQFIIENFLFGENPGFADSDSLLDAGILDSTGVLQLVEFLGSAYGVTVLDGEITPANLDSIDCLAAFLERKKAAREMESCPEFL